MLDYQLFGLNPGGHHLTNLFIHIANTLLLFVLLKDTTGKIWPSAAVSAMFSLHPLHVESVAWVSERKDVLSTFFWLMTIIGYSSYVKRGDYKRYLFSLVCFTLGLLSKPMVVTLPFVLLLLDYWPLNRVRASIKDNLKIIVEKIPFLLLSLASCAITFYVQKHGGSVGTFVVYPLTTRIANAIISYVLYIEKLIWPCNLIFFYPYPDKTPITQMIGALNILILLFILAIINAKKLPYFIVGFLWYVGTLVPVVGFVQVGSQSMADRYTYIPSIGIFIVLAWLFSEIADKSRYKGILSTFLAVLFLSYFSFGTWLQLRYWKNDVALYEHALRISEKNTAALNNLGVALLKEGKLKEATEKFKEVLVIEPNSFIALSNIGVILEMEGKREEAIAYFKKSIQANPNAYLSHLNLGIDLALQGKKEEAIKHYREAIRINPDSYKAHLTLSAELALLGKTVESQEHLKKAQRIYPNLEIEKMKLQGIISK